MAISNFISTVWSENLLKQLDRQYVGVLNCNREFEGEIKSKGSIVNICGFNGVTVMDYENGTDMEEPEVLDTYYNTLEVNRAKYFNFQIDDIDKAQANIKFMDAAMKVAASSLASEAENYVYSLYKDAVLSAQLDEATSENIVDKIIDIKTILMNNNASIQNDLVLEVSPDVAKLILKAKIDLGTDNHDAFETGYLGKIAGCKVYVSNNINVDDDGYHQCFLRTKRAIAFAEQISEVEAYRPEKRFADAVKGLHIYGAKVVCPAEFLAFGVRLA